MTSTKHLEETAKRYAERVANGEVSQFVVTDVTPEGYDTLEEKDELDQLWERFLSGDLTAIEEAKNI